MTESSISCSGQEIDADYRYIFSSLLRLVFVQSLIYNLFAFFQVATLKEEVESLKAEREKVNSSMKDIIHGAEGYKVGLSGIEKLPEYPF